MRISVRFIRVSIVDKFPIVNIKPYRKIVLMRRIIIGRIPGTIAAITVNGKNIRKTKMVVLLKRKMRMVSGTGFLHLEISLLPSFDRMKLLIGKTPHRSMVISVITTTKKTNRPLLQTINIIHLTTISLAISTLYRKHIFSLIKTTT